MKRVCELANRILRRILHSGPATRPELIAETGARAASVLAAVDALKAEGWLQEPGRRDGRTGRRSPVLECNPGHCWFAGVDLQLRRTVGVVVDAAGNIVVEREIAAPRRSFADARREIARVLSALREASGSDWQLVSGIGFADPGVVDTEKGISLRAVNVPGWENLATAEWLTGEFKLPVRLWPEEQIKTRMEYLLRLPDSPDSLFHLGMDGGIGGGFIRGGKLFIGSTGHGMEIGHVVVAPGGEICHCGSRGCLEVVAGEDGIRRRIAALRAGGVKTELDPENFSLGKLVAAVPRDKAAGIIADEVCAGVGLALSTVVALLNPQMIVLSGELTGLGDLLISSVRRALTLNCFAEAVRGLRIEKALSGPADTARGAAIMFRDRILFGPEL